MGEVVAADPTVDRRIWRALSIVDPGHLADEVSAFAAMTSAEVYAVYCAVGDPTNWLAPIPWQWKGPICRAVAWLRKPALASLAAR